MSKRTSDPAACSSELPSQREAMKGDRGRRLAMYSAVAGAAGASLTAGGTAEAERVPWSPPEGLPVVIDDTSGGYSVDLDDDGTDDFDIHYSNAYGGGFVLWTNYGQFSSLANTSSVWNDDQYYQVRRLEGGQRINSNTFAGTTVTSYGSEIHAEGGGSYDSLPYTAFQGGAGYLPIQLHEQVELNPGEFYGFLRVIVNDAGDELSILDGAYDDVRYRAINTPEPGALASLAASALTLAALRRRSSGSRVRGSR